MHAAMRITFGSKTLVRFSTPVFSPYVVLAGAPNIEATAVATPSPVRVRCKPGWVRKSLPTVELMASMSPICSMMVAKAIGMMARMEESISVLLPSSKTARTVRSLLMGKPTHAASLTGVKSTSPISAAITYEAMTPSSMGIIFTIPLPHTDEDITTTMAMMASSQLVWQLAIAEPDSTRPIAMTIGPVTTGGK